MADPAHFTCSFTTDCSQSSRPNIINHTNILSTKFVSCYLIFMTSLLVTFSILKLKTLGHWQISNCLASKWDSRDLNPAVWNRFCTFNPLLHCGAPLSASHWLSGLGMWGSRSSKGVVPQTQRRWVTHRGGTGSHAVDSQEMSKKISKAWISFSSPFCLWFLQPSFWSLHLAFDFLNQHW